MHLYRCYVLDGRNRVAAIKVIQCDGDLEAGCRADALLVQMPTFHGVEVWERERRVHINPLGVVQAAMSPLEFSGPDAANGAEKRVMLSGKRLYGSSSPMAQDRAHDQRNPTPAAGETSR
jgi:hypothetical protein